MTAELVDAAPELTPWSDSATAELAAEVSRAVMKLARRLRGTRDDSLTPTQVSALVALSCHEETMTMGELAATEKVQPPSMTRIVDQLVARGLAERRTCSDDRRALRVSITHDGREVVRADRARRHSWLAQRLDQLGPEERATLHAATALLERLTAS